MNVQTIEIDNDSRAVVHDQHGRMFFRIDALMGQLVENVTTAPMDPMLKAPMLALLVVMEEQLETLDLDMKAGFNTDEPL